MHDPHDPTRRHLPPMPIAVSNDRSVAPARPFVRGSAASAALSERRADRALANFACLWAFAALFHQSAYPELIVGRSALFVTLPALWLLLKPSSLWRLLAVAALQVLQVSWNGPAHASNHWVFVSAVNLTILLAVAWLAATRGGNLRAVTGGMVLRAIVPVVRVELAILYGFAVLHKLNADFLTPAVSCASTQYAQIAAMYPVLPQGAWVDHSVIWGTLLVEAAIPVMLFVRRTRLLGVVLGALFHFVLTLNPAHVFFDFTSVLVATYFLFLPFDYWTAARGGQVGWGRLQWLRDRIGARRLLPVGRALLVLLAVLLVASYGLRVTPDDPAVWKVLRESVRLVWVLYFVGLAAIFVRAMRRVDVTAATRGYGRGSLPLGVAAVLPVLLLVNGMTPYLGFKTEASFAMFSNLRTEVRSNHLFMPEWLKMAGYQEDLVRIHTSSDPQLARMATRGQQMTWFDFRTLTRRLPGTTSVTYTRGGTRHEVPSIGAVAALDDGPSAIPRRLLRFRVVEPLDQPMPCRH